MAKISVRGRECDSLYKKTKVSTLGRILLASGLTLLAHALWSGDLEDRRETGSPFLCSVSAMQEP